MENILFEKMHEMENKHWWFVARRKIISRLIKSLDLGSEPKIFDAGCGNGDNLELLSKYGSTVAMERERTALENARERNLACIHYGELPDGIPDAIPTENSLIVLLDVLEHIEDDEKCLENLKSYVNEKGYLLVTVPAYQFLWSPHDEIHHHKRRYTVSKIEKVFSRSGWEIKYISYFNTLLFPLALIDRIINKIRTADDNDILTIPNDFINSLLQKIFALEQYMIGKLKLPFGLSIILVAQKMST